MSNGTKKLGKDFQASPKLPSVTVRFGGEKLWVDFKNASWEVAVDLLLDGLKLARIEEKKAKQKGEPSRIVIPSLAGIPPLKES